VRSEATKKNSDQEDADPNGDSDEQEGADGDTRSNDDDRDAVRRMTRDGA
jgi:hypothetical protein